MKGGIQCTPYSTYISRVFNFVLSYWISSTKFGAAARTEGIINFTKWHVDFYPATILFQRNFKRGCLQKINWLAKYKRYNLQSRIIMPSCLLIKAGSQYDAG